MTIGHHIVINLGVIIQQRFYFRLFVKYSSSFMLVFDKNMIVHVLLLQYVLIGICLEFTGGIDLHRRDC